MAYTIHFYPDGTYRVYETVEDFSLIREHPPVNTYTYTPIFDHHWFRFWRGYEPDGGLHYRRVDPRLVPAEIRTKLLLLKD